MMGCSFHRKKNSKSLHKPSIGWLALFDKKMLSASGNFISGKFGERGKPEEPQVSVTSREKYISHESEGGTVVL